MSDGAQQRLIDFHRADAAGKVAYLFAEAKEAGVSAVDTPARIRWLRHSNDIYLKRAKKASCAPGGEEGW